MRWLRSQGSRTGPRIYCSSLLALLPLLAATCLVPSSGLTTTHDSLVADEQPTGSPCPGGYSGFGHAVATNGSAIVVGAPCQIDKGFSQSGLVYVFNTTTGALVRTLSSPNAQYEGYFGYSVAMSGSLVIVGAPSEAAGGYEYSGRAYVFNAQDGALVGILNTPDPALYGSEEVQGEFGASVALSGSIAVVGAPQDPVSGYSDTGLAFVFNVTTGAQIKTLESPAPIYQQAGGEFGASVGISGNLTIVGEPLKYALTLAGEVLYGAAYVLNTTSGAVVQGLNSPEVVNDGDYGGSVAIDGNLSVVGAPGETAGGDSGAGTAYVFNSRTGRLNETLVAPNPESQGRFGASVAVSGNLTVVSGSPYQDGLDGNATAYLFDALNGTLMKSLTSPDALLASPTVLVPGGGGGNLVAGQSLAISGRFVVMGIEISSELETLFGLAGRAYGFDADTGALVETVNSPTSNVPFDQSFGNSVAVSRTLAIVGAPGETVDGMADAGEVYAVNLSTGSIVYSLVSPDPQPGGGFGFSVALSSRFAVVGAYDEAHDGYIQAGNVYVFDAQTGALVTTLTSPAPQDNGNFGYSVAISHQYAIVGAPYESVDGHAFAGNAYVFNASSGALTQPLTSPESDMNGSGYFGSSVAISGAIAIVGAPGETVGGPPPHPEYPDAGRAQVFNTTSGALIQNLTGPNTCGTSACGGYEYFGFSVAISGNLAVVGAPGYVGDYASGSILDGFGSAQVFNISTGNVTQNLTTPNATAGSEPEAQFGSSVAISGGFVVVGADTNPDSLVEAYPGEAYVFKASSGALTENLTTPISGDQGEFGHSVAISGNHVWVGAPYEEGGHAYEFRTATGALERSVVTPAATYCGYYNGSVAVSGDLAVVGAPDATVSGLSNSGRAYVVNATTGTLIRTFTSPNASAGEYFGYSVAMSGALAVVGAYAENAEGYSGHGSVYVFNVRTGAFLTLNSPYAGADGHFGFSVAIGGGLVIVGAPGETAGTSVQAGNAYVFDDHTGVLIQTLSGPAAPYSEFGFSVAIDGGMAVVGAPDQAANGEGNAGVAYVYDAQTATLLQQLVSPNAEQAGNFGYTVAVAGRLAVVGAPGENLVNNDYSGRVYEFDSHTGRLIRTITSPNLQSPVDPDQRTEFGAAVAISGNDLIVGAPASGTGAPEIFPFAYVLDARTGAVIQYILSPDPLEYENFGEAVAISNGLCVVGYEAPS